MPLTLAERTAGRVFRGHRQALLATLNREDPPVVLCSPWSPPFLRHDCRERPGGTLAMPLREVFVSSPSYVVGRDGDVPGEPLVAWPGCAATAPPFTVIVPASRFRFTYLAGRCHHCQALARSSRGHLSVMVPG